MNQETSIVWPEEVEIEGTAEIYLRWKNLAMIAFVMIAPLLVALLFESFVVKIICWGFCVLAYVSYLPVQGPCVQAIIVGALPWYVFLEWSDSPTWLAIIAAIVSLIELSYIRHRMHGIEQERTKAGILL